MNLTQPLKYKYPNSIWCRKCEARQFVHVFNPFENRSAEICNDFIPDNNLEYLEWCAEKQGLLNA